MSNYTYTVFLTTFQPKFFLNGRDELISHQSSIQFLSSTLVHMLKFGGTVAPPASC